MLSLSAAFAENISDAASSSRSRPKPDSSLGERSIRMRCLQPTAPRRMLTGTLSLPNEAFLKFAERVKPDMVVMGAFGAPQWAAEKDPRAWLAQWKTIFKRMHRSDIKVVGMIELLNVGGDMEAADRWLEFYEMRWDEKLLGKKGKKLLKGLFGKNKN